MAFTGTPTLKKITDKLFRITGVSLAGDASGTIKFDDATVAGEVELSAPNWDAYKVEGISVSLQDAVKVDVGITTDVTTPVPVSVVKSGTTHLDFAITLHNDTAATASGDLEIYVYWGGH